MSALTLSASQTVGPFFHDGLLRADARRTQLVTPETAGERIRIAGHVYDGDGLGVPDAMLEIWQPETGGFARVPTDADGAFSFTTVPSPFLSVTIFMRGLLRHLHTRIYLSDGSHSDDDPVLRLVEPARRRTLMARPIVGSEGHMEWNVVLQGEDETVFFEC